VGIAVSGTGPSEMRAVEDWTAPGIFEVAPGIHRIPLPLPNDALRAVNVYALDGGSDGCVLVDSGWALDLARERLEQGLDAIGRGLGDVSRFLVTHAHRDHYTLGVVLRRTFGTRLALGLGEQPNLERILASRVGESAVGGMEDAMVRWGAQPVLTQWRELYGEADRARNRADFEEPDEWLTGGADLEVGKRTLRVLPTPGHTRGHVVFLDATESLLFSGDHVLPHITPSIGFEPAPVADALGSYLRSLRLLLDHPDAVMLPAHGAPGGSVHVRVHELLAHHEARLAATREAVAAGAGTAYEAAQRLGWTRRAKHFDTLDVFNRLLATGETAAHLEVLVGRGVLGADRSGHVTGYALADDAVGGQGGSAG
jgi:glyoxylase-like metal-dependent hydrolase (beta-lactamase superfamily II)